MVDTVSKSIRIEEIRGIDRAQEIEELQMAIWGSGESWVVPTHVLHIVSDYGGILLGAQLDGKLVGFVLGFLARENGTLFHASHMLGVLPGHQQHGIGAALKWAQREQALGQGLDLMTWTFDPLESRNAYFNIHKLGVISRTYYENYYGSMKDALNQGLPSDRLRVEWHLRGGQQRTQVNGAIPILLEEAGKPQLRLEEARDDRAVSIQVPRDFQVIKRDALDLALAWRRAVREAFDWAFSRGFVARDFVDGAYILVPAGDTPQ